MSGDKNYTKILEALEVIHNRFPDMRFGQVLQTALDNSKKRNNVDFHDISSKEFLKILDGFKVINEEARKRSLKVKQKLIEKRKLRVTGSRLMK